MGNGRESAWPYKPKNTDSKPQEQSGACGKENEVLGLERGLGHQKQIALAENQS